MAYQVLKGATIAPGVLDRLMRGSEYATQALAQAAAQALTPDEEITVELRTGSMSRIVLVIPKV